jgi:SM-20-related protein
MMFFDNDRLDAIADQLVGRGYLIIDNALPESLLRGLLTHFNELQEDQFKTAGIGRRSDFQQEAEIRSDKIHWITANTEPTAEFLQGMEALRVGINRRLFMGVCDYECHFAHYPIGAFYKKHVDAFRSHKISGLTNSNRVLSTVLYLNETWQQDNGGELVLYAEEGERVLEKVLPEFGRLVIFLSEEFPHEVLPANQERKSIAGWFRVNEGLMN